MLDKNVDRDGKWFEFIVESTYNESNRSDVVLIPLLMHFPIHFGWRRTNIIKYLLMSKLGIRIYIYIYTVGSLWIETFSYTQFDGLAIPFFQNGLVRYSVMDIIFNEPRSWYVPWGLGIEIKSRHQLIIPSPCGLYARFVAQHLSGPTFWPGSPLSVPISRTW